LDSKEIIVLLIGVIAGGMINYLFYLLSNRRLTKLTKMLINHLEGTIQNMDNYLKSIDCPCKPIEV
jgi:hypothetical protein